METPAPKPSRFKKYFRRMLFTVAALITLGALFFAEEYWRGSRAWSNYKRDMEAKGESFDPARLIPPMVPDGQNLAMIPFFTVEKKDTNPVTDQAILSVLEAARQRPYCRFNIRYEDWSRPEDSKAMLEQFDRVKQLCRELSSRAEAGLDSGRPDQAMQNLDLLFRVNDGVRDEPLLMSQMVAQACARVLLEPLVEGLAEHRWTEAQLRVLQQHLQQTDLLASTVRGWRGDRDIVANQFFNGATFKLRGWDRLEQLNYNRAFQDMLLPRFDLAARRVDPGVNHSCDLALEKISAGSGLADELIRHRVFTRNLSPAMSNSALRTAEMQTDVDEVMVACALERYRLAEGHYPDTLDALVPRFAAALPHDIINGQPLKFRRIGSEKFLLYSVGWNQKDDGGTIATNKSGKQDKMRGDWVFEYPD